MLSSAVKSATISSIKALVSSCATLISPIDTSNSTIAPCTLSLLTVVVVELTKLVLEAVTPPLEITEMTPFLSMPIVTPSGCTVPVWSVPAIPIDSALAFDCSAYSFESKEYSNDFCSLN